jgi:hypothetical protein
LGPDVVRRGLDLAEMDRLSQLPFWPLKFHGYVGRFPE